MKTIVCLLFFIYTVSISAQFVLSHEAFDIMDYMTELKKKSFENQNLVSEIEGSPYIFETFLPIKFTASGDHIFQGRFNAYDSNLEVIPKIGEAPIAITNDNKDLEFTFVSLNKTYRTYTYIDGDIKEDFFVQVLILKNVSLLKKEQIKLIKEVKAKTPFHTDRPAKYTKIDDSYYLKVNDKSLVEVPTNKNKLAELFPEDERSVLQYIKKERINLKDENDLISLINFLNNLK